MEGEHESSIRTSNKYALPENAGTAREFRRTESRGAKDSKIEAAPAAAPMSAPARRRILTPSSSRTRRLPPSTIAAARRNKSIQQLSRSHFPGSESVQLAAVVMLRTCTRNHEHLPHTQATNPATTMTATTALKRDVGSVVQGRKSSQSSSIVVATCIQIVGRDVQIVFVLRMYEASVTPFPNVLILRIESATISCPSILTSRYRRS